MTNDKFPTPAVEGTMGTCESGPYCNEPHPPMFGCVNWKPLAPSDSQGTKPCNCSLICHKRQYKCADPKVICLMEKDFSIRPADSPSGTAIMRSDRASSSGEAAPSLNSVDTPAPVPERTKLTADELCDEMGIYRPLAAPVPEPEPRHEIASGREFAESEQNKATKSSAESPAKTGGGTGNGPDTTPENREDELTAPSLRNEPLATICPACSSENSTHICFAAEPPARKDELGTCQHNDLPHIKWGCCDDWTPVAPQAPPEHDLRKQDTPESKEHWDFVAEATARVEAMPEWKKNSVAVGGSPEAPAKEDDYLKLPQDAWFFHDAPSCLHRYSVQRRTSGGCSIVCSTPYTHDGAKRDMREIVRLHEEARARLGLSGRAE